MFYAQRLDELPANRTCLRVALLRLAAALGLILALIMASAKPALTQVASARPHWNPANFLINAFVVPALAQDEVPLHWFDPRAQLHCGPDTTVSVNGKPLVPGTAVPVQPFELTWQAHDCRPFGEHGPRANGGVTLIVYREDWGFSATVLPDDLRLTWPDGHTVRLKPGAVTMPQQPALDETD